MGFLTTIVKKIFFYIIGKTLTDYIYFLYGCLVYKKSFSQNAEDLIIINYLNYKKIYKGKYIDIGSFHPIWISNTHLLHKNGFSGICVDLSEEKLKFFRILRGDKVRTICGAVSNLKTKFVKYFKFNKNHSFSEIDTLKKHEAEMYKIKTGINYKIARIKNYNVNEIFKMSGKINVLNIDIEGIDIEVLIKSDLNLINPEIIIFEDNKNYFQENRKIDSHLKKIGYRTLFISGGSKGYAKK
jgi:hypothetical protein